jgi:branched-chain amino acid transport system permease protein
MYGMGTVVAMILLPGFLGDYPRYLLTLALIYGLFAMSYDIMLGYTGVLSVCHASLFGISSYTMLILMNQFGMSLGIAILFGIVISMTMAAVIGFFSTRSSIPGSLVVMTIIFSLIFSLIAISWTSVTGGENGLILPFGELVLIPKSLVLSLSPGSLSLYYLVLFVLLFSYLISERIVSSPLGMAIGYNTNYYEILSSIIAGFFASIAGILYVFANGFVGLDALSITLSVEVVIWSMMGGLGTLIGPIIGAGLMTIITDLLKMVTAQYLILVGIIFIVVVIFFRRGIVNFVLGMSSRSG